MKTIEYTTIDKSKYKARGPWDNEIDKKQWQDPKTGLACLIHRGPVGALCGYVGVPEGHPLFKVDYTRVSIDVHGGLTYSNLCQPSMNECTGICHTVEPGEPDHVWWLGFDCAHSGDMCPSYEYGPIHDYKDQHYVEGECSMLARQIHEETYSVSPEYFPDEEN